MHAESVYFVGYTSEQSQHGNCQHYSAVLKELVACKGSSWFARSGSVLWLQLASPVDSWFINIIIAINALKDKGLSRMPVTASCTCYQCVC